MPSLQSHSFVIIILLFLFFKTLPWGQTKAKEGSNQSKDKPNREDLTWNEEQYTCSKGFVESVKGGVMDEGHDANDDANKTSQKRQDHEGAGGV